jgi:hypothetical protein
MDADTKIMLQDLRGLIESRKDQIARVKRKRSWPDSVKAMTLGDLNRQIKSLRMAIHKLDP